MVEQVKSPVVQSQDYYPFGLAFNSHSRENTTPNQYQYNSKELQDELSLGWLDYQARQYDPALGRFLSLDPAADIMRRFSPYVYTLNNPLRFIDPDGMIPEDTNDKYPGNAGPAGVSEDEIAGRIADHDAMNMDHAARMMGPAGYTFDVNGNVSNSSGSKKEERRERRREKRRGPGDDESHWFGLRSYFWMWGKMLGINKLREANVLILGNGTGSENWGTKELGLGETFVLDLSNPENVLSVLSKMGNSKLLGSGFAVVETASNRGAVLYLDHLPKDGETIDGWTFTDCNYSAGQVGGQIHASKDSTQTGDIYKVNQGENGKFVLIRAGQHE